MLCYCEFDGGVVGIVLCLTVVVRRHVLEVHDRLSGVKIVTILSPLSISMVVTDCFAENEVYNSCLVRRCGIGVHCQ